MKYLVLVGDGMADYPLPELNGHTPLEIAHTPALDTLARDGILGQYRPIPVGLPPGSDIGNLSLFGYDPRTCYTGRAPLEAAAQGISLTPNSLAFRCNLVTLGDGCMVSSTSSHISTREADELIQSLSAAVTPYPVRLYSGVSYRHLAIVEGDTALLSDLENTECTPPHDITGLSWHEYTPKGPGASFLVELMDKAREVLRDHTVNQARASVNKGCATDIWLWGQGRPPHLQPYPERFGITGSVVSAVDLIKGLGICAGLCPLHVEGVTGYLDTNYKGKVDAITGALSEQDFGFLHVEATDEASHEGRIELKLKAIEDFDRQVVTPCLEYADKQGDIRILAAPDHVTRIATRTHDASPVPFAIWGADVTSKSNVTYTESNAAESGIMIDEGFRLLTCFIKETYLSHESLCSLFGSGAHFSA